MHTIRSFINLFTPIFINSAYSFIHSCMHTIRSFINLFTPLFIYSAYSFIPAFMHAYNPLIHYFIHSFIHILRSMVQSFIHSFIHSCIHLFVYSLIHLWYLYNMVARVFCARINLNGKKSFKHLFDLYICSCMHFLRSFIHYFIRIKCLEQIK